MLAIVCGRQRTGSIFHWQITAATIERGNAGIVKELGSVVELGVSDSELDEWARASHWVLLKAHNCPFGRLQNLATLGLIYGIQTVRDPRDSVVSSMNFWHFTFEQALEKLASHFEQERLWRQLLGKNILIEPYESSVHDLIGVVKRVSEFLHISGLSDADKQDIADSHTIEANLRRAAENHPIGTRDYFAAHHIHSGEPGQWMQKLTQEQAEAVMQLAEDKKWTTRPHEAG